MVLSALPPVCLLGWCIIPAYVFKRIYDIVILPEVKNFLKLYLEWSTSYKTHDHHSSLSSLNLLIDKYLHYFLFNSCIIALDLFGIPGTLFCTINPMAASLFSSAIVGAALQGNPDCPAQQQISAMPPLALLTGAVNGMICCGVQHLLMHAFASQLGLGRVGSALAFVINWGISAEYMCKVEGTIVQMFGFGDGAGFGEEGVYQGPMKARHTSLHENHEVNISMSKCCC